MAEQWIIRVEEKEYGPADIETLRDWKREGRVLPTNQARAAEGDVWVSAAKIPGLFEEEVATVSPPLRSREPGSFGELCAETLRIYRKGFGPFLCLTLLVVLPSLCGQLVSPNVAANSELDTRTLLAGSFALCMLFFSLLAVPIYIAGIQILSAEIKNGRRMSILALLQRAISFWPRVALLCVFVYLSYFFWIALTTGLIFVLVLSGPSFLSILCALILLVFQVWIVGRLFVNFLFWQQFAVIANLDPGEALRESKQLARSRRDLIWFRRPLWRGVFIASLWCAAVIGFNWPPISFYFQTISQTTDVQAMLDTLKNGSKTSAPVIVLGLGLLQSILKPLLGIAFVVLYFENS